MPQTCQFDLFGEEQRPAKVLGAPTSEEHQNLSERLKALAPRLLLGTSSWTFPGWKGIVYDRDTSKQVLAHEGLRAYASHPLLRTVGIDRSWYEPLSADAYAAYAVSVPEDFRFVTKAHALCTSPQGLARDTRSTHEENDFFLRPEYAERIVIEPFERGAGKRAGIVLFQFPPLAPRYTAKPRLFAERLWRFLDRLKGPRSSTAWPLLAVELRNAELAGQDYFAALAASGALHCVNIHPGMRALEHQLAYATRDDDAPLFIRWSLAPGARYERSRARMAPFDRLHYRDHNTRSTLTKAIAGRIARTRPVVVIVNNKAEGCAPLTVFELAARIANDVHA